MLLGLFAVLLTSFPSLCSCTAPQSTLPLLPSSSSSLLCSLFCTLVLLQCLCTSVSAAVSGRTDPKLLCDPRLNLRPMSPKDLFSCCKYPSFRLFAKMSVSLSKMQRAANFPPTLAWNISDIFRSFSFSNRMRGLFVKRLVFSFSLMVVRRGHHRCQCQCLVLALLVQDLKFWGVRMKSIWL